MIVWNLLKISFIVIVVLIVSMLANVYLHELGHFMVADSFALNPEIHLTSPVKMKGAAFSFNNIVAYTSYNSTDNPAKVALIAIAGPGMNILIALIACLIYLIIPRQKRTWSIYLIFIIVLVSALFSAAFNLIPVYPSDGYILLQNLFC